MSNRPDILMRVGAAFDRSFDVVLADAKAKLAQAFGVGRGGNGKEFVASSRQVAAQQLAIAREVYRENSKLVRQELAEKIRAERRALTESAKIARQRTRERLAELHAAERAEQAYQNRLVRMQQAGERERNRVIRAESRARYREAARRDREIDRFATRTSHRATRFFFPPPEGALGFAKRTALDVARGAGINFNLGTQTHAIVEQEKIARNLSTQAYIKGSAGPAGARVDPRVLQAEARESAKRFGVSTEDVLLAGKAFVGQRGNLAGFRALQDELVKRSVATGTDIEDVGMTAAKIDSALATQGEYATNEKARNAAIIRLLDNFIMQGKVGSVEFEHMAKEIPKLSGIAASFTGDTAKNLSDLLVVTQLAERGPAKNAATASTYAQNFALDLPKRAEAFKSAGVSIFDEDGRLRGLEDIMIDTLLATENSKRLTKGRGSTRRTIEINQMQQLAELMPNKRSFLAMQEFLNVFRGAGGGKAGVAAIRSEFVKFGGSNAAQLNEDVAGALKNVGAKANRFNAQLEEITQRMVSRLVPAFDRAEPSISMFLEKFSELVTWAAENPGKAITAAITASIARAGLESVGRLFIDRLMTGVAGSVMGGAAGSGMGAIAGGSLGKLFGSSVSGLASASGMAGVMGTAGAAAGTALLLAGVGIAAYSATTALLEMADASREETEAKRGRDLYDIKMGAVDTINSTTNPLEAFSAMQRAKKAIIAQEEKTTGYSFAAKSSDAARGAIATLERTYAEKFGGVDQEREYAKMAGFGDRAAITEDGLSRSFAGALVGQTLEVTVKNLDEIHFTPSDQNAKPDANQLRFFQ